MFSKGQNMGGITRTVIIDEKNSPVSFLTWTGSENEFFFSEDFANGEIAQGITKMCQVAKQFATPEAFTLSPGGYGLTVIDFKNKQLFCKTDYDSPSRHSLSSYILRLSGTYNYEENENPFIALTENNQITVVNELTQERFSLIEFFGTNEVKEIIELINRPNSRINSNGYIKNEASSKHLFQYYITPTNFDLSCHYYSSTFDLFKDLYANYPINENDINNWCEYLENREDDKERRQIEEFFKIAQEKDRLDITLNQTSKSMPKTKI